MSRNGVAVALVIASCLGALACGKSQSAASEATGTQGASAGKVDLAQAKDAYNTRCSACHGTDGRGDGPGAAALNPKPRNYRDKAWQASVTDEQIKKTITMGGAAVGKSPVMPGSPDLDGNPAVLDGLVAVIRDYGK